MTKRATDVLALMREPDKPYTPYNNTVRGADFTKDGEWFYLLLIPNISRKTVNQLLEIGAIERKPARDAGDWTGHWTLYRLIGNDEWLRQDYGDLWVPFDELPRVPNGQGGP